MKTRKYETYDDYIKHQKKKTLLPNVKEVSDEKFNKRVEKFKKLFSNLPLYVPKRAKALCLGARRGEEIVAMKSLGYDAIGVDLVAFPPLVIEADFHNLPFEDNSFDLAFSNTIDHVLELDKFANEVSRVIKSGGYALFHLILNEWSDEMSLGANKSSEIFEFFKDSFSIVEDSEMKRYGGGLNHILMIKRI